MTETPNSRRRAIEMLLLATLFWGISFPVIKSVTQMNRSMIPGAGTWFIAAQALGPRFAVAAVLLFLLVRRDVRHMTRIEKIQGIGIGFFAAAGTLFQTDALQFTSASTSAFLTQFSAILIPVWFALRRRRSPGWVVWLGCLLVITGVAVLGGLDVRTLAMGRGEWETLLSSLCFTGQILWVERPEFAGNRKGVVTFGMFSTQAACFGVLLGATTPGLEALAAPWHSAAWLTLTGILAVVCTIAAFWLMNRWQPSITATEASLVYCVEPVFAAVFALFMPGLLTMWCGVRYPNEHLTWSLIVGGTLITAANILVLSRPSARALESSL